MDFTATRQLMRGPVALAMAPFRDDLTLDTGELKQQVRHMVDGGLGNGRGVLICPSGTGEYVTLDADEHLLMVEAAVEAAAGKLPIVAGVASNDIRVVVSLARQSMDAGATAVMVSPPFYYRMDIDSYERWLRAVADEVPAPIMVYAQQWRSDIRSGLSLGQLDALASIPNVISIKYGSPAVFHEMITALDRHASRFAFIDNSLGYTFTIGHMHGSSGYIAGPAAWWPEFELRYWDMLEAGNYREAEIYHSQLAPYMQFFMGDEFPGSDLPFYFGSAVIKATFEWVGLYGGPVRPPFRELTPEQKADLFGILARLGAPQKVAVAV